MSTVYKVLGQVAPTNTENANLYTVGAGKQAVVSTIAVSNTTNAATTGRVFIRIAGTAAAQSNALIYDASFPSNSVSTFTIGITLSETDIITVQSNTANALTFHAFGSEIS
jgi:hypothetical protein